MDSEPMLYQIRSLIKSGMTPKIKNGALMFSGNMTIMLDIDSGELVMSHIKIENNNKKPIIHLAV